MLRSKNIPADPTNLINYLRNHFKEQRIICAYEAGPTGFGLYDALTTANIPCLVVAPTTLSRKPNQKVKNDRINSRKLAKDLKAGELASIHVPLGHWRQLRSLVRTYQIYINSRTAIKCRIKSLMLLAGLPAPDESIKQNWCNPHLQYIKNLDCHDIYLRQKIDLFLNDLQYVRSQCFVAIKQLRQFHNQHPDIIRNVKFLCSIDGIGFITALVILAKIGNPSLLVNQRQIASFIGIVPSEHSSGELILKGSITRMGDTYLRSMIIESSWVAIRKNKILEKFFSRIKDLHHPSFAKRKAIMAVARKLTLYIYCVLKQQRPFMVYLLSSGNIDLLEFVNSPF